MDENLLFRNLNGIDKIVGFDFSRHTTYGLGGKCRAAFLPKSDKEAMDVFDELNAGGAKYVILGKGSNILASDGFYGGYVLSTLNIKGITAISDNLIYCSCGTSVKEFLAYCYNCGLSGAEFLYGIPATMGGVAYMNGGAGGRCLGDLVKSVIVYDGKIKKFDKKLCNFTYKHSTMRDINAIILGIIVELHTENRKNILSRTEIFKAKRKLQPKGKSCGCVFKNHNGRSAGEIIESCGLKGAKIGGAKVSPLHANFIINDGATSFEVFNLINFVKNRVYELKGVKLEEEVCYIGDFYETHS